MRHLRISSLLTSFVVLLAAAACRTGPLAGAGRTNAPRAAPVASAADVLARVLGAHANAPRTAAFTQANTVTLSSGDITQRQRVLIEAPDRMRVDNLPVTGQTGAVYVQARAFSFSGGRRVAAASDRNPLLLLGFGVFRQPVARSLEALSGLGVRTSVIREESFNGMPVWVIGAAPGDTVSNQVWIDSQRWIPVRLIQSLRTGARTIVSDTRYSGHTEQVPTVPRVIEVYREGRRALRGAVGDLRVDLSLPAATFDTTALRPVTF